MATTYDTSKLTAAQKAAMAQAEKTGGNLDAMYNLYTKYNASKTTPTPPAATTSTTTTTPTAATTTPAKTTTPAPVKTTAPVATTPVKVSTTAVTTPVKTSTPVKVSTPVKASTTTITTPTPTTTTLTKVQQNAIDQLKAQGKDTTAAMALYTKYNTSKTTPAATTPTTPKTNVSTPPKTLTESERVTANLTEGLKNAPNLFSSREQYEKAYNYAEASPDKKAAMDKFYTEKVIPSTKVEAATSLSDESLLGKTKEQLAEEKQKVLTDYKESDVNNAKEEYNKGLAVLGKNNAALAKLYGVDAEGNIDENNTTSIAYQTRKTLDEYKKKREDLMNEYSSARYSQVRGQIAQMLAQRGLTLGNTSPEDIIALSGQIGATAFTDVYNDKVKATNEIKAEEDKVTTELNKLRESGVIKQNEYNTAVETLRASTEKLISTVNKEYVNSIFNLADTSAAAKETGSAAALDAINKFGAQLGLTGSDFAALQAYAGKFTSASAAITQILKDLNNPSSPIYKAIKSTEARAAAAAAAKNQLELYKIQSYSKTNKANEPKPAYSNSDRTKVMAKAFAEFGNDPSLFIENATKRAGGNAKLEAEAKARAQTLLDDVTAEFNRYKTSNPSTTVSIGDFYRNKYITNEGLTDARINGILANALPELADKLSGDTITN